MTEAEDDTRADTNLAPQRTYTNATVRETYRTGDGDAPVHIRPGALDFKDKPSGGAR